MIGDDDETNIEGGTEVDLEEKLWGSEISLSDCKFMEENEKKKRGRVMFEQTKHQGV